MSEHTAAGISRRDLIKKGAIAGGLVWAAPMITKVTPAYGQSSPLCTCTSGTLYRYQFTMGTGNSFSGTCPTGASNPTCEPTCWDSAVCGGTAPTGSRSHNAPTQTFVVTLPVGAVLIADSSSCARAGNTGELCASGTRGTDGNGQTTVTYTGCETNEVVNLVYCLA